MPKPRARNDAPTHDPFRSEERTLQAFMEAADRFDAKHGRTKVAAHKQLEKEGIGAGFDEKTHIQIAVRNSDCIKGVFRVPRQHLAPPAPARWFPGKIPGLMLRVTRCT